MEWPDPAIGVIESTRQDSMLQEPLLATRIWSSDNPGSVRTRKYLTGTNMIVDGVGVEVGTTPRDVLGEWGNSRVYHYPGGAGRRHATPLLLVYALILRPYILDLAPGRSLIEELVDRGFDVYLLDWGVPTAEDHRAGLERYVHRVLAEAVRCLQEHTGAPRLSILGHCQGGTISTIYSALYPDTVRNLILLAAPIDFDPGHQGTLGTFTLWARNLRDPQGFADVGANVPADVAARLSRVATTMTMGLVPGFREGLARLAEQLTVDEGGRAWLGICRWVDDHVPFPGRLFEQWIRWFYQGNQLVRGELCLDGEAVRLDRISASLLNVVGSEDLVTPLAQAVSTPEHLGAQDTRSLTVAAGHVGLIVGPDARTEVWEPMIRWLTERSD